MSLFSFEDAVLCTIQVIDSQINFGLLPTYHCRVFSHYLLLTWWRWSVSLYVSHKVQLPYGLLFNRSCVTGVQQDPLLSATVTQTALSQKLKTDHLMSELIGCRWPASCYSTLCVGYFHQTDLAGFQNVRTSTTNESKSS